MATAAESNFLEILEKDGLAAAAKQFILVVYGKTSKKERRRRVLRFNNKWNGMEKSWKEKMMSKCEEGSSNEGIRSDNE